jgi:hypothetical protein
MKWYRMSPTTPRSDVWLLHEYNRRTEQLTLLERYQGLRRCELCDKIDEDHLRGIGFDDGRILSVGTDFWGQANDTPKMIVRERVKALFEANGIGGVEYLPCGLDRKGERIYVLWKHHESKCLAPRPKWCYNRAGGQDLDEGCCPLCLRSRRTLGFPYHDQLVYPALNIISVPDIATGIGGGQDFRFFCSKLVRDLIRKNKLSGISLPDVRCDERFYPRSTS